MNTITLTKIAPPEWLLAMWKEIDDKPFGKGFDCFAEDAICNLGVADWHGREAIRENLRQFIDKGFTAHHDVVEFWDSPLLKVFHGKVGMKFDDPNVNRRGRSDRILSLGAWLGYLAANSYEVSFGSFRTDAFSARTDQCPLLLQ